MAHIWRDVVMLGRGADKHPLHLRLRGTPERKPSVTVVIVHIHHKRPFAADKKRRVAMAQSFRSLREREANPSDMRKRSWGDHAQWNQSALGLLDSASLYTSLRWRMARILTSSSTTRSTTR